MNQHPIAAEIAFVGVASDQHPDGGAAITPCGSAANAATYDIPVVFVIQDNSGFMSIRGGQRKQTSRHVGTEFNRPDGTPYSPDFKAVGEAFGLRSYRVGSNDELEPTLREAVESGRPALVVVPTDRDAAGPWVPGWWDFSPTVGSHGACRDSAEIA